MPPKKATRVPRRARRGTCYWSISTDVKALSVALVLLVVGVAWFGSMRLGDRDDVAAPLGRSSATVERASDDTTLPSSRAAAPIPADGVLALELENGLVIEGAPARGETGAEGSAATRSGGSAATGDDGRGSVRPSAAGGASPGAPSSPVVTPRSETTTSTTRPTTSTSRPTTTTRPTTTSTTRPTTTTTLPTTTTTEPTTTTTEPTTTTTTP